MNVNDFKTVEVNTDLLILGGGMAACGAAYEAAFWARKNNLKVTLANLMSPYFMIYAMKSPIFLLR